MSFKVCRELTGAVLFPTSSFPPSPPPLLLSLSLSLFLSLSLSLSLSLYLSTSFSSCSSRSPSQLSFSFSLSLSLSLSLSVSPLSLCPSTSLFLHLFFFLSSCQAIPLSFFFSLFCNFPVHATRTQWASCDGLHVDVVEVCILSTALSTAVVSSAGRPQPFAKANDVQRRKLNLTASPPWQRSS